MQYLFHILLIFAISSYGQKSSAQVHGGPGGGGPGRESEAEALCSDLKATLEFSYLELSQIENKKIRNNSDFKDYITQEVLNIVAMELEAFNGKGHYPFHAYNVCKQKNNSHLPGTDKEDKIQVLQKILKTLEIARENNIKCLKINKTTIELIPEIKMILAFYEKY
jgi:hypothetical protein